MPTDLLVELEDRPGSLAELATAFGRAGVNLAGVSGVRVEGRCVVHLLVDGDPAPARDVITSAGLSVSEEREVLVVGVHDEPGMLGSHAGWLAEAGVNIEFVYLASKTRLVFGVDDLEKARRTMA